ncbi:hypothetical protein GCM10010218_39380 [Streptomyces mashuensis]|uniref:Bulb-type lectin domain-containing protein n=2 Tax=Streptomyces mashuensis TaxID=33904 RepID=A0A919EE66_9ACTN|nr:hypothetical protein GCM10010218_39380 [Streptomyces mashuensis]
MATNCSLLTRAASVVATAVLAATGVLVTSGTAHAERAASDTLVNGGTLASGARLASGGAQLVMQQDGDLALYASGANGAGRQLRWHSGTTGVGNRAELRADGNLVVTTPDGVQLWQSRTGSADCAHMPWTKLTVRSDGDMAILAGQDSEAPYFVPLWSASFGLQPSCGSSTR